IDRLRMARGRAIAPAIVRCAQVRPALQHLAQYSDVRLSGGVALLLAAAARILRDAARLRRVGRVLGGEPVAGPLPDVADLVVEAISVPRKGGDRRRAHIAGGGEVLLRKRTLPGVGHMPAAGCEFIAPG